MNETIFTKIINRELPSHTIYEYERVYAFLDIHPITPGHTLVIPKQPVEFLWDLDDADYKAVHDAAKKIARQLRTVLDVPYIGSKVIGVDVPHAHLHLVPFHTIEEYRNIPDMDAEPDHAALAELAAKIKL